MDFSVDFKSNFFSINNSNFEEFALKAFEYQSVNNPIYKKYLTYIGFKFNDVNSINDIPYLPIEFFKKFKVVSGDKKIEVIFESSGTTGQERSKHHLSDVSFYNKVSTYIFESFYGNLAEHAFFALLPSYAERDGSSLIHMVHHFITQSARPLHGFYLQNYEEMISKIKECESQNVKLVLIGVSFALLELAEKYELDLRNTTIIETGGMKGRRKELVREELHDILKSRFNTIAIGSEYGMTELLSQAYAKADGIFSCPPWMKVSLRNPDDPFEKPVNLRRGGINIIDLANIDSCCFIETKDLGEKLDNETFKILGRFDNSEIRGCNLLV